MSEVHTVCHLHDSDDKCSGANAGRELENMWTDVQLKIDGQGSPHGAGTIVESWREAAKDRVQRPWDCWFPMCPGTGIRAPGEKIGRQEARDALNSQNVYTLLSTVNTWDFIF